ncbi:lytic transglycosylase [Mycobacterium kansasii]
MSLDALVEEVGQALGGAQRLYGVAPRSAQWGSTGALSGGRDEVWQASGAAAQNWRGASGSTYVSASGGQVQALDSVVGADRGTDPEFGHSAAESRTGRRGMDSVINDTRSGVAALAPSTDTPAGRQQLVNHLQSQLHRAKGLLRVSEQRNITLATMIRNAASGYRPAMGAAMRPAMGAGTGALPMMGVGAPGLATPNLTGLSALIALARPGSAKPGPFDRHAGLHLRPDDIPQTPGAATIRAAIRRALDIKGITDPVARANWETGMMIVSSRESGHNPAAVNNSDSNARKGTPSEGAFQFIRPTFVTYHEPGTSPFLRDPVAQAAAFINYVQDRYGVAPDASNLPARVQQADPTRPPKGY